MKTTALLLLLQVPFSLLGVLGLRLDFCSVVRAILICMLGYLIMVCCVLLFGCQFERSNLVVAAVCLANLSLKFFKLVVL